MSYAVGIDLGTTNSVVSIFRRGVVETLPIDGRSTMPSVVSFRDGANPLVGQAAKSRLLLDPETTVASVKRSMGDRGKQYTIGRKSLSPVDISSEVLKRLMEGARTALGGEVRDAVITVPAYFTEAQKEDTKKAGEKAGLNVLRLLPEPTAAAIAYGLDKGKDQTIMVYDLGGGTFDVSILEVSGNRFEVKAVGGDSRLGGDDFDQAIMTWANEEFRKQTRIDLMNNNAREGRMARQRLKEAAEVAKIELSQSQTANLSVPDCMGHPLELELTLVKYNALIAPLLNKTVECMKSVLRDAALRPDDIDRVILVGGSTKNRAVRDIVAREIKEPYTSERVDEVVSHGAAVMAANLFLPDVDMVPIEVTDVTGHSLGVDLLDEEHRLKFVPIIPRQTIYPCKKGIMTVTSSPYQTASQFRVFRGENEIPEDNTYLGVLLMPISPPQPDAVPVVTIFELDADGIIHFTAVQLPLDNRAVPFLEQYNSTNELDMAALDELVKHGIAHAKTVSIKTQ